MTLPPAEGPGTPHDSSRAAAPSRSGGVPLDVASFSRELLHPPATRPLGSPQGFVHRSRGIVRASQWRGGASSIMQALPLIAELEAALTSGAARRVEMLARITELFISEAARYSEEQVGVFDDVMVRLASTVGADARAKLAQRLAPIANAPSSLTHMLAFDDEVEIATPILSQSERLEDFRPSRQRRKQAPAAPLGDRPAPIAARNSDRRADRARRPRGPSCARH